MIKNIQIVSDAFMCSNCGACKVICPKDAISFVCNPLGRMYATVNEHCINCSLCVKVCPSLDIHEMNKTFRDKYVGEIRKVYVGKSANIDFYKNAQSGGACVTILDYLFETQAIDCAVVCRMSFGKTPTVQPVVLNDRKQLCECQKSCYTPVDLLSALKGTLNKESVAIVGLPCHIQGVEALMRNSKRYSNIKFKIGLICDRTLCGGIQNVMLSYFGGGLAKIIWRRKDAFVGGKYYPYKDAPVTIMYENGKEYVMPNYYRFVLKDYFTSPRCRVCYDKLNSFSDIVLGDPWGMSGIDWQKGESVIIVRNQRAQNLINSIVLDKKLILSEREIIEVLKGQHIEERRRDVSAYSLALQFIPIKIKSYLYAQEDAAGLSTEELFLARREIELFISRDGKAMKDILNDSRSIIRRAKMKVILNKCFLVRIFRKIEQLLK